MSVNAFYEERSGPKRGQKWEMKHQQSNPVYATRKKSIGPNGTDHKRVGKKTEATLLAGMIDEIFEAFDKPVSQ